MSVKKDADYNHIHKQSNIPYQESGKKKGGGDD